MASLNADLIITALLRQARAQPDPLAWLMNWHTLATAAVMAQDEYVTEVSGESGTNKAMREMPASVLLPILEVALQRFESAEAAGTSQTIPGGPDFSQSFSRV